MKSMQFYAAHLYINVMCVKCKLNDQINNEICDNHKHNSKIVKNKNIRRNIN